MLNNMLSNLGKNYTAFDRFLRQKFISRFLVKNEDVYEDVLHMFQNKEFLRNCINFRLLETNACICLAQLSSLCFHSKV